jgi:hypothetical protein
MFGVGSFKEPILSFEEQRTDESRPLINSRINSFEEQRTEESSSRNIRVSIKTLNRKGICTLAAINSDQNLEIEEIKSIIAELLKTPPKDFRLVANHKIMNPKNTLEMEGFTAGNDITMYALFKLGPCIICHPNPPENMNECIH